jgi:hypothetical protein
MNFTLYKITNNINGKIYIGVHKTDNIDDGYMGSGKVLKRAINKYGIDSFTKEILHTFDSREEMFEMESQLVNEDFVKRTDTYNIRLGGFGGFDHVNDTGLNVYGNNGMTGYGGDNLLSEKGELVSRLKDKGTYDIFCKKMSDIHKGNTYWLGKTHTDESKEKIGKANSKHQTGKGNSNYGKCWIHNLDLKKSMPIPRYELDQWLSDGWIKGRKMKF